MFVFLCHIFYVWLDGAVFGLVINTPSSLPSHFLLSLLLNCLRVLFENSYYICKLVELTPLPKGKFQMWFIHDEYDLSTIFKLVYNDYRWHEWSCPDDISFRSRKGKRTEGVICTETDRVIVLYVVKRSVFIDEIGDIGVLWNW